MGVHLPGLMGSGRTCVAPLGPASEVASLPGPDHSSPVSMTTLGLPAEAAGWGGECAAPSAQGSPEQRALSPEGRPPDTQTDSSTADSPATPSPGTPAKTPPPPCCSPAFLCCSVSIATAGRQDRIWIPGGLRHPFQARSHPTPAPHCWWCRRLGPWREGRRPLPKTARETLLEGEGGGGDRQSGDSGAVLGR